MGMRLIATFSIVAFLFTFIPITNAAFGIETLTFDSGTESVKHNWRTVSFSLTFSNTPVVIADIQSEAGGQAAEIELRNVSTTGFQLRVEEDRGRDGSWLNGPHVWEEVAWFAFDPNEIVSGYGVEGGISNYYQAGYEHSETVSLSESYAADPYVFAQLQTNIGRHVARPDITSISTTSFDVRTEEDPGNGVPGGWDGYHLAEDMGYLALDSGLDLTNEGVLLGEESVGTSWASVLFAQEYSDVPAVFVEIQSENESDTVQADIRNVTTTGFEIRLEEQMLAGWDGSHVNEDVAWMAHGELLDVFDPSEYNVWVVDTDSTGDTLIQAILVAQGYNVTFLDSSHVETDLDNTYDLLVWPGGIDPVTDAILNTTLQDVVKEYMDEGGNYIGVCGGAIAGSETVFMMDYPYLPWDMTLDTFGTGEGVNSDFDYDWTSFIGAAIYPDVEVETDHEIFDGNYVAGDLFMMTYAGGPVFNGAGYTTLATYTDDFDVGYAATGEAAIVETEYTTDFNGNGDSESGGVILFGLHPEFLVDTYFLLENSAEYLLNN